MSWKVLVYVCMWHKEAVCYSTHIQASHIKLNTRGKKEGEKVREKVNVICAGWNFLSAMTLTNCAAMGFPLLVPLSLVQGSTVDWEAAVST